MRLVSHRAAAANRPSPDCAGADAIQTLWLALRQHDPPGERR
jgi:hypothetical protein